MLNRKSVLLIVPLAFLSLAASMPAPTAAPTSQPDVTGTLNSGTALALVEVTAVQEKDSRPSDGNDLVIVSYNKVKTSGKVPDTILITIAYGGRRVGPAPVPSGPLIPNPLVKGQRYWIIFNDKDPQKYPQGVSAWYPEKDAPAALDAAIAAKKFDK